jgi:signal transduction histidine kinase
MGASVDKRRGTGDGQAGRTVPRFRPLSGYEADTEIRMQAYRPPAEAQRELPQVNRLVAETAHDFNNILSVILSCADELLLAPLDDEQRQRVLEIRAAGLRASALNRKLVDASRAGASGLEPSPTDVAGSIEAAASLLRRTLGRQISLEIEIDEGLPAALCANDDLIASLLNIGANGRDAMPGGGTLVIRASQATIGTGDPVLGPGWYVRIDVADDGVGMTPRVLRRAPDPYFTTKAEHGTGLGLPTVAGIARASGGDLRIASAPGAGTTVTILLPAVTESGVPLALGAC